MVLNNLKLLSTSYSIERSLIKMFYGIKKGRTFFMHTIPSYLVISCLCQFHYTKEAFC